MHVCSNLDAKKHLFWMLKFFLKTHLFPLWLKINIQTPKQVRIYVYCNGKNKLHKILHKIGKSAKSEYLCISGRNPTTGEPFGDGQNCEFKAAKTQACCINPTLVSECPIPKEPS